MSIPEIWQLRIFMPCGFPFNNIFKWVEFILIIYGGTTSKHERTSP